MRATVWTLVLGSMAATIGVLPAMARDYPYCIRGCDFGGGLGNCSFSSYEQCQATASGREASCAANPYFNADADAKLQPDRSRQSRRRF